jgi:hypothetical protein
LWVAGVPLASAGIGERRSIACHSPWPTGLSELRTPVRDPWYAFRVFECLDADPATLTGAELCERLFAAHTDRIRADAAECRYLADWDSRQVWAVDGALSGAAWLRNHHGVASRPMRERLRVAGRLRSMPLTAAAFEAGELAYEKVRLLANARTDVTAEVFDRDESTLVDSGRVLDTDQFAHVVRYWRAMADAAGFGEGANARHERRRGWLSETLDGMIKLDALLDPETGRIVKQVLEEIMGELHRADRRDTANGVGVPERTRQQRVADALAEMARRAATSNPTAPAGPAPKPCSSSPSVFSATTKPIRRRPAPTRPASTGPAKATRATSTASPATATSAEEPSRSAETTAAPRRPVRSKRRATRS